MSKPRRQFRFSSPQDAIDALLESIGPVAAETVGWQEAVGRVLAAPVTSDRESPPSDTSAMDGYAVRIADLARGDIPVAGEVRIGRPTPPMPIGSALKIVTGAPVPAEADAVIPRELTVEHPLHFALVTDASSIMPGANIRRRGENLPAGAQVMPAGTRITPAVMSALATFGVDSPRVHRRVRIGILITGDELLDIRSSPLPWQIRDCNGPVLTSLVKLCPWLELVTCRRSADDQQAIAHSLNALLDDCDALLITGGVSMGDYDYIPDIVTGAGAKVIFHGLPIRPGQPVLGAVNAGGKLIMGLPGNPVSVMTCACRFARPALARLAGFSALHPALSVNVVDSDQKRIGLWWYRPVTLADTDAAQLVPSRGSGDMVSAARSDGFVEIPPDSPSSGRRPFYRWEF